MAKVTVYITNFNYGRFVEQAIRSVLDQTFTNFELIIIDDGSTDGSQEILFRYETPGKIFVVLQHNLGLNAANNVALKLARGEYIMRLDADDYLHPKALESLVHVLDQRPEVALVFPDYYLVNEDGTVVGQVQRHDFGEGVSLLDQPAHGACTMIRRQYLLEAGGYDESFACQDGYDLWLKITERHSVRNVNLPLFYYRQHPASLTRDESRLHQARSGIMAKAVERRHGEAPKALGVIPVRGKASDPASIALEQLGSQAVIDWTINAALSSKSITDLVVTTPDPDIRSHISDTFGDRVQTIGRSPELARLNLSGEDAVIDAIDRWRGDSRPDAVAVLFIEAPFRRAEYIEQAVNALYLHEADCIDAVRPDDSLFYLHDGHGMQPWRSSHLLRLERDDIYRRVGGLHVVRTSFLLDKKTLLGGKVSHIVLDEESAFTVRSEFDWRMAVALAQGLTGETRMATSAKN